MPYAIHSHGDHTFSVINTATGKVHGKKMSKSDAKNQLKLLNAIEHGYDPDPRRPARRDGSTWTEVASWPL